MKLLDGSKLSAELREKIKSDAAKLNSRGIHPLLATILVGDDPASSLYVKMKTKAADAAGIQSKNFHLSSEVSQNELLELIDELNNDHTVHGVLVQLPLPSHIDVNELFNAIRPQKDVDGLNPLNMGALMSGDESLVSCTPKGVITLIEYEGIRLKGAHAVIVSHSVLVGKPLSMLFLNRNATVTVCHIHTRELAKHTHRADILVSAAGVPNLIKKDMIKKGAVVVDVGTSRVKDKLVGDVDFEGVKDKVQAITPVPGGVGPMTITMLLRNTLIAAEKNGGN
ncbi:MAG: bifunctional methylenetetrahydrofolate dehydrogenase/methenyltetrahydrofolate cyclohydrolase [Candidatus Altiarchaeales archaeon ex4484_96]|nr:MAG: bifunctional methylenetetrahydrofolate dehydrogenase/methenyltetrahydrofolate cyclohydrolase [Candidatus Altiarchaeales archaeon ex4484_96]